MIEGEEWPLIHAGPSLIVAAVWMDSLALCLTQRRDPDRHCRLPTFSSRTCLNYRDCKSSWKKNLFQPQLQLGDQMTHFMSMKYRQKPFGLVGSPQGATSWIKRESFLKRKPLAHCPLFFFFVNLVVRLRGAATIKRPWIDERGYENYYIKDGGVEKEKEPRSLITLLSFSISSA